MSSNSCKPDGQNAAAPVVLAAAPLPNQARDIPLQHVPAELFGPKNTAISGGGLKLHIFPNSKVVVERSFMTSK